jgi:spore cortex formation protein SpoVR/YcgB (stage V sporulation)
VALIFDQFQVICNDAINQELLDECRKMAFNKAGYDVQLKVEPFDKMLNLPDTLTMRMIYHHWSINTTLV